MLPNRGAQLGLNALKHAQIRSTYSVRTFSSITSRPVIRPSATPTLISKSFQSQRRGLTWNPLNWGPSNNEVKSFEGVHTQTTQATSSTGAASGAASSPVSSSPTTNTPAVQTSVTADPAGVTENAITNQPATWSADASPVGNLMEVNTANLPPMPLPTEQIGYLKSLGIEYGYGPTATLEWLLEHVHVYSGMPWWGSITVTAVIVRLLMIPLLMKNVDTQARMSHIKPELNRLQQGMMAAYHSKDQNAVAIATQQMSDLRLRAGVSFGPMIGNVVINMAFAIGALRLMRSMADLPVPGLLNGGMLWFTDLTVPDPYYALPLLMAGSIHAAFRFNSDPSMALQPSMRNLGLYILPAITFVSMCFFSAAVNLWLASAGAVTILTGKLLQMDSFKEAFGLVKPAPQSSGGGGMLGMLNNTTDEADKKTIKVEPVRSASIGGVTYQAPRVNATATGATNTANAASNPNPNPDASLNSEQYSARLASAIRGADNGAKPANQKKGGMLERYVENVLGKVNSVGEGYQSFLNKVRKNMGKDDKYSTSKRDKDYMKSAEAYEKNYRKSQQMRNGR